MCIRDSIYREVRDEKDGKIEKVVNLNQEIEDVYKRQTLGIPPASPVL